MKMAKSLNRMSIEHILCSPCEFNESMDYTYYGLPSPVSSCDSNEEDDYDDDDDYSDDSLNHNVMSYAFIHQQPIYQHHRSSSNDSVNPLHGRAILPYRRRRCHSTNSSGAQISAGQARRTPWTPDEDMLLKQGYEEGLSWAMIASVHLPHRSRGCCWGRFKTLKNKKFLTAQRQIRAKTKPWKTLNPLDMQQSLLH